MPPPLNRPVPKTLRADQMRTYGLSAPAQTHARRATCEEVGCALFSRGWRVRVEGLTPDKLHHIKTCGKRYELLEVAEGQTYFVFEAGQQCFTGDGGGHTVRTRPFLYLVKGGDWRGNPLNVPTRVHTTADSWVDDFSTHSEALLTQIDQG